MKSFLLLFMFIPLVSFRFTDLKPVDADDAVSFSIKNFGIGTKGTFKGLRGTIKWDVANPAASSFNVSVDVNTVNTGITSRDSHLKKEEYFDVAKYPTLNFVSSTVSKTSEGYSVTGNLTIKGTTKQVVIPFTVTTAGNGYLFEGNFTLDRRDYKVGGGSMVLGNEVKVTLKIQTTT